MNLLVWIKSSMDITCGSKTNQSECTETELLSNKTIGYLSITMIVFNLLIFTINKILLSNAEIYIGLHILGLLSYCIILVLFRFQLQQLAKHLFLSTTVLQIAYLGLYSGVNTLFYFISIFAVPLVFSSIRIRFVYFVAFISVFGIYVYNHFFERITNLSLEYSVEAKYICFYLVVFVLSFPTIHMFRKKIFSVKKQLDITNTMLLQEVEEKNKLLIEKACSLTENGELIKYYQERLENIKSEGIVCKAIEKLLGDISEFSQIDVWEEFDEYFNDLYPDFEKRLLLAAESLTRYEIRICLLIKLGLASKDICRMMRKTVKSIEVARTRIRKKMMLDRSESLFSFLDAL